MDDTISTENEFITILCDDTISPEDKNNKSADKLIESLRNESPSGKKDSPLDSLKGIKSLNIV